ncbi:hypothetical protein BD779DRAFT_1477694 [Infundibulicybe gibba]|nr:hypothetical protein BD779DRAFT_1477694 [Infundibulicybe gibba]
MSAYESRGEKNKDYLDFGSSGQHFGKDGCLVCGKLELGKVTDGGVSTTPWWERALRQKGTAHPKTTARQTGIRAALVKKAAHDGVHELPANYASAFCTATYSGCTGTCLGLAQRVLSRRFTGRRFRAAIVYDGVRALGPTMTFSFDLQVCRDETSICYLNRPRRHASAFSNFHCSVQGFPYKVTPLGLGRQWLAFQSHALGIETITLRTPTPLPASGWRDHTDVVSTLARKSFVRDGNSLAPFALLGEQREKARRQASQHSLVRHFSDFGAVQKIDPPGLRTTNEALFPLRHRRLSGFGGFFAISPTAAPHPCPPARSAQTLPMALAAGLVYFWKASIMACRDLSLNLPSWRRPAIGPGGLRCPVCLIRSYCCLIPLALATLRFQNLPNSSYREAIWNQQARNNVLVVYLQKLQDMPPGTPDYKQIAYKSSSASNISFLDGLRSCKEAVWKVQEDRAPAVTIGLIVSDEDGRMVTMITSTHSIAPYSNLRLNPNPEVYELFLKVSMGGDM